MSRVPRTLGENMSYWIMFISIRETDFESGYELALWKEFRNTYGFINVMMTVATSADHAKDVFKSRVMEGPDVLPCHPDSGEIEYNGPIHHLDFTCGTSIADIAPYKKALLKAIDRSAVSKMDGDTILISVPDN